MGRMWSREQRRQFEEKPWVQTAIFIVGVLLMIAGGIFVFAGGLALVLRTSMWAKRHYVRFKRWQPKAGRWADWGLRRQSAKRRDALAKARRDEEAGVIEAPESVDQR